MLGPAGLVLFLFALPHAARADGPITDRHYAIDAHRGAAVADYRVIGMGGVSLATAAGSAHRKDEHLERRPYNDVRTSASSRSHSGAGTTGSASRSPGDGARRYGNTVLSLGFWH
jgi:hypothetical protein